MNKSYINSLIFALLILVTSLTNAQTLTWPFGEQGGDSLYMQPDNFWAMGNDSNDVGIVTARAANGTKFHYGYFKGADLDLGDISLALPDQIPGVHNKTAVVYNTDTALYMHTKPFFNVGGMRKSDNNYGLLLMTSYRSNGANNVFTESITVRNENDLSLKKEYYLTDFIGSGSRRLYTTILDSNRIAISLSYMVGNYVKMYTDINVVANNSAVSGGTEISMDNVPNFVFGEKMMIIIDMTTDSVVGYSLDEDYFTTKSLGDIGHVDIMHGDTSITFNWYDSQGDSVSTFVDDIPVYLHGGFDVSGSMPTDYSLNLVDVVPNLFYGRRGNSSISFDTSTASISLLTDVTQHALNADYANNFLVKDNYLYTLRADEMNYHIDVYDLNVGPNAFVTHFRNDVQLNGQIGHDLGTPDEFSIDIDGDSISVSFVIESSANATMSIGGMGDFMAYQDRSISVSYDFILPDNPLVTVDGYEVSYSSPDLEYITHAGFHRDTLFVSPNADLENIAIAIIAGDSILSYLMYQDRYYTHLSLIDPIVSGSNSDFSIYNKRVLHVSNRNVSDGTNGTIYDFYRYIVVHAPDSDGNGVSDFSEGKNDLRDTDADGQPDYLDLDNDGDGVSDADELAFGAPADMNNNDEDGDGIINESHDDDEDDDGIEDAFDPVNNIGIEEINNDIDLFSNNATLFIQPGSIFVESSVHISFSLTDALGKNHGEFEGNSIEIHNLNQGVYFIQVNSEKGMVSKKVLVY